MLCCLQEASSPCTPTQDKAFPSYTCVLCGYTKVGKITIIFAPLVQEHWRGPHALGHWKTDENKRSPNPTSGCCLLYIDPSVLNRSPRKLILQAFFPASEQLGIWLQSPNLSLNFSCLTINTYLADWKKKKVSEFGSLSSRKIFVFLLSRRIPTLTLIRKAVWHFGERSWCLIHENGE